MSTLMASLDTLDPESLPRRHRITVDEYLRMGEVGLFAPDARVELIEGEVFDMAPIGDGHNGKVDRLNRIFVQAVGGARHRTHAGFRPARQHFNAATGPGIAGST